MSTFADIKEAKKSLIRKALNGLVAVADMSTPVLTGADLFNAAGGPLALPNYRQLGWYTAEGQSHERDSTTSDIKSHGSATPTRTDITGQTKSIGVAPQETKKTTLESYFGVSLTGVIPQANGTMTFDEPPTPRPVDKRIVAIAKDDSEAGEIYIVKHFLSGRIRPSGGQTWANDDNAMTYPLTIVAQPDDVLGVDVRHFFGGPGWKALLVSMGFPAAPAA